MQVVKEQMPVTYKFKVHIEAEVLEEKKNRIFDKTKGQLEVKGFRKGQVPKEIAEKKLGVEFLYKPVIDEIYEEIVEQYPEIISSYNFSFFGDLTRKLPLDIEFISDIKPEIELTNLELMRGQTFIESNEVTEEEIKAKINFELKQNETIQDSNKEILENFDLAIIDFDGFLEGEATPFKGGQAKNYQICVNEIQANGQKQFIDNFEDQLVGMKIGENRNINVKFPDDYRDKTLSGKKVVFKVVLKSIKIKKKIQYNLEFVNGKGFNTIEDYEHNLKEELEERKTKKNIENFKKKVISEIVKNSKISPIPKILIERENEKEWQRLLQRMGKTEGQLNKESKLSKSMFFENNSFQASEIIKTTLILEQIAKNYNVQVSEEEVLDYVLRLTSVLNYDEEKKEKIKESLKTDKNQYKFMYDATKNEKVIDFLFKYLNI